jgi:hypothetical protein
MAGDNRDNKPAVPLGRIDTVHTMIIWWIEADRFLLGYRTGWRSSG